MDNRRLAIDLCEMIIKWELFRIKECQESEANVVNNPFQNAINPAQSVTDPEIIAMLLSPQPATSGSSLSSADTQRSQVQQQQVTPITEKIDKVTVDRVVDILIRMASTVWGF